MTTLSLCAEIPTVDGVRPPCCCTPRYQQPGASNINLPRLTSCPYLLLKTATLLPELATLSPESATLSQAFSDNFVAVFGDYSFGDKVAVSGNKVAGFGNRCEHDFRAGRLRQFWLRCITPPPTHTPSGPGTLSLRLEYPYTSNRTTVECRLL